MTHDEEQFNQFIQRMARNLDPTPEVPREELWARIDAARRGPRTADAHGIISLAERRGPRPHWIRWAASLAAMLLIGVAIGRLTLTGGPAIPPTRTASGNATSVTDSAALLPYRLVAAQHLRRTETLLAALPGDARRGQTAEAARWAGDLLTDTRLLLDSPASQDPSLNKLLQDLELVLAQIAALPADRASGEVQLIEEGMNQRDVLLRLRAATAGRALAGS